MRLLLALFHIAEAIAFLFFLFGLIKSLIDKTDKFFGLVKMEALEWSFLLLIPIVVFIIVDRATTVKLWKRITGQDKLDELLNLIDRDRELIRQVVGQRGQQPPYEIFLDLQRRVNEILYKLKKLGFTIPSKEELTHVEFFRCWYYFINRLEIRIKNENYKDYLGLWSEFSPVKLFPQLK